MNQAASHAETVAPSVRKSESRRGQRSLFEQAYFAIRNKILRGDFPFGSILSRRELAAQLHMSFLPVTQALQRLEQDGLVESRPRVGTRVRIPTAEDIDGLYVLREALESQAARLCSVRASDSEQLELRRMAARLDKMFTRGLEKAGDRDRNWLFDLHIFHLRLHTRIAECARSAALLEAIERNQVLIYNFLFDIAAKRAILPPSFHQDLVEAIVSGDREKADAAMRAHVRFGLDETLRRLRPQISRDAWRIGREGRTRLRRNFIHRQRR